jgi:hypothetical protein
VRILAVVALLAIGGAAALGASPAVAQQVADSTFLPKFEHPAYPPGQGPLVLLDEAHHNFHTKAGRYGPFARVLEADGFVVRPNTSPFTAAALRGANVLVIANALHASNETTWVLPTPSAFAADEITAVRRFVEDGGALFLIADHMPFPGAADSLARAFGVRFDNGFALLPGPNPGAPAIFRREAGRGPRLAAVSRITLGTFRRGGPNLPMIDSVASFTGSAFRPPEGATSLLTLPDSTMSLAPDTAWTFRETTPKTDVSGWSQGAIFTVGKGRVAVFGEAAMFTAQRSGGTSVGMNAAVAAQNSAFLVRLVRWLATGSPEGGDARSGDARGASPAQSSASK